MIQFEKPAGWRCLEIGCGANPHPQSDIRVDVRSVPGVTHFTCDFNADGEWPEIRSNDFEMVLGIFVLEHISWRRLPNALQNVHRILKPGGKCIFVVPNTTAQLKWIEKRGWEKRDKHDGAYIESARILFGDLDYPENSHKSFFSPEIAIKLFSDAGFVNVTTLPFGHEIETDMVIEASKEGKIPSPEQPKPAEGQPSSPPQQVEFAGISPVFGGWDSIGDTSKKATAKDTSKDTPTDTSNSPPVNQVITLPQQGPTPPVVQVQEEKDPASLYNWNYFNSYQGGGFAWDYPNNEVIFRKIMERAPKSVFELGCARGYILKKLQDAGLRVVGCDVSKHAFLTKVCDEIMRVDLTNFDWKMDKVDLALSLCFLEHIPEHKLDYVIDGLKRVSERGLHAVVVEGGEIGKDPTRVNLKPLDYWRKVLPAGHEVLDYREFAAGPIPEDYVRGDGKTKLNIGCAWTMFHNGWTNIDEIDGTPFANPFRYNFVRQNIKDGLFSSPGVPYSTGIADLIFTSHMLEHLTYEEGLRFLRECRRVIRPSGAMRIVVPDIYCLGKHFYSENEYGDPKAFDEVNEGCAKSSSGAAKLWSLIGEGHKAFYDERTLEYQLREAGWNPIPTSHRKTGVPQVEQILKECIEMSYGYSLFMDAVPI